MKLFSVASGSSGNCIYYSDDSTDILVDAGLSGKKIQLGLEQCGVNPKELGGILVTHEHNDHIMGVGIMSRRFRLPIYLTEKTYIACKDKLGKIDNNLINYFEVGEKFNIGNIKVESFDTYHDAVEPVGFSISSNNIKLGILTDTGKVDENVMQAIYNSEILIMESNHDEKLVETGPYPWNLKKRILGERGHLSNTVAAEVLVDLLKGNTKKVLLAHLSQENNFPQLAKITVETILAKAQIAVGKDVELDILPRQNISPLFEL